MRGAILNMRHLLDRRAAVVAGVATLAVVAAAATPGLLGEARVLVLTVLVAIGGAMGTMPLWWLGVFGGMLAAAVLAIVFSRRIRAHGHVVHLLDAFRGLAREPLRGLRIAGWIAFATVGRLLAAAAVAASMGVHHPVAAALIIIPALDVAGQVPLTPGNVGVVSGAVVMAVR